MNPHQIMTSAYLDEMEKLSAPKWLQAGLMAIGLGGAAGPSAMTAGARALKPSHPSAKTIANKAIDLIDARHGTGNLRTSTRGFAQDASEPVLEAFQDFKGRVDLPGNAFTTNQGRWHGVPGHGLGGKSTRSHPVVELETLRRELRNLDLLQRAGLEPATPASARYPNLLQYAVDTEGILSKAQVRSRPDQALREAVSPDRTKLLRKRILREEKENRRRERFRNLYNNMVAIERRAGRDPTGRVIRNESDFTDYAYPGLKDDLEGMTRARIEQVRRTPSGLESKSYMKGQPQ